MCRDAAKRGRERTIRSFDIPQHAQWRRRASTVVATRTTVMAERPTSAVAGKCTRVDAIDDPNVDPRGAARRIVVAGTRDMRGAPVAHGHAVAVCVLVAPATSGSLRQ